MSSTLRSVISSVAMDPDDAKFPVVTPDRPLRPALTTRRAAHLAAPPPSRRIALPTHHRPRPPLGAPTLRHVYRTPSLVRWTPLSRRAFPMPCRPPIHSHRPITAAAPSPHHPPPVS